MPPHTSSLPFLPSLPTPARKRYPKRISAAVAAILLGGGGGAFAVATLAPGPDQMAVQQIFETIESRYAQAAGEALPAPNFSLYRTETVRSADTADSLLRRLGLDDLAAADFLRGDASAHAAIIGRAGRSVTAESTQDHHLVRLTARWLADAEDRDFQRLVVERDGDGFKSWVEAVPLSVTSRLATATIRTSLLAATDDANIPDSIATQIVDIFDDVDFSSDLRRGDRFNVVYETLEADGEPLRAGRVLSVEFATRSKSRQAIWFQPPGTDDAGKALAGGYYTPAGQSLHRTFLASPMEFSRVTSGFRMREHPIAKTWRAHLGVDYGAPTGTPVRSVADGTIDFAGVQNGYGNVIYIKHRNNTSTVYAHLSKISVKTDQAVSQGDNIGLVGSSGWATGPHLHFEFRVDGVHQDPLTIAERNDTVPLATAAKPAFLKVASMMRMQLAAAEATVQASAE
ncbi:MAG: M23 family metallopeptidase [Burkholderiales bacterium]